MKRFSPRLKKLGKRIAKIEREVQRIIAAAEVLETKYEKSKSISMQTKASQCHDLAYWLESTIEDLRSAQTHLK